MGRCPYNRVVNLSASEPLSPGELLDVDIVGATPHSLLAQPLLEARAEELAVV